MQSTSLYYGLNNFYQNHRRYVQSRWDPQLAGETMSGDATLCDPLTKDAQGRSYMPCGLVANSLFNDTIQLYKCVDSTCASRVQVSLSGQGISWASDREVKFRNPKFSGDLCAYPGWASAVAAHPPNWPVDACNLGQNLSTYNPWSPKYGSSGRGYENEDLIVWMRTAGVCVCVCVSIL